MATNKAFQFIPHGAIIQKFIIDSQNCVLSFDDPEEYNNNPDYFGATIGRVANRIAKGKFHLNNQDYNLYLNEPGASLHGGKIGWNQKAWNLDKSEAVKDKEGGWLDEYSLISQDGDENFPGTVTTKVKYLQYKEEFSSAEGGTRNVLEIEYETTSDKGSKDTVINLTNHSYFNLSPPSSTTIDGTLLTLPTNIYLPVDSANIPTADPPAPFPNVSPNEPFTLGATSPSIDHCFLNNPNPSNVPLDTRPLETKLCARAYHPVTRFWLEVSSTEPAFQIYTGDGIQRKTKRGGFCVEPSRYVDAINRDEWRGQVVVKEGEVYGSRIVFKGWKGLDQPHIPPNKPE